MYCTYLSLDVPNKVVTLTTFSKTKESGIRALLLKVKENGYSAANIQSKIKQFEIDYLPYTLTSTTNLR